MKHSFKLKKSQLRNIFSEKLEINSISIENRSDVYNTVESLLNFIELEDYLNPTDCSYNFLSNQASFQLELKPPKDKEDFFSSIKKFEDFVTE